MARIPRQYFDEMPCNVPMKSTRKGKKRMVKACAKGKQKLVHYGAEGYEDFTTHKDPKRRKKFHRRHNCKEQQNILSAAYWACTDLW